MQIISKAVTDARSLYETVGQTKNETNNTDTVRMSKETDGAVLILSSEAVRKMKSEQIKANEESVPQEAKANKRVLRTPQEIMKIDKVMSVFRVMKAGETVNALEEQKLLDYNPKMYALAKSAQRVSRERKETVSYTA